MTKDWYNSVAPAKRISNLQEIVESLRRKNNRLKQANHSLESRLVTKDTEISALQGTIKELMTEIGKLNNGHKDGIK